MLHREKEREGGPRKSPDGLYSSWEEYQGIILYIDLLEYEFETKG